MTLAAFRFKVFDARPIPTRALARGGPNFFDSNGGVVDIVDARHHSSSRFIRRECLRGGGPMQQYRSFRGGDSNGRLVADFDDVSGDSTPDLADSIANFSFVSRQIAIFRGPRCQKWIEEGEGYPTVVSAAKLEISVEIQLPDIAGSIAKFSFVSRQIALYRGRRCQKWIAESEGYPMVSISQRLDNSTNLQLIRYRKMASRPQYYRYRVRTRIHIGRAYLIQQSITREGNEDRRRSGLEVVISNNILLC